MMDENLMKEVALFRFSLIAPIVSETYRDCLLYTSPSPRD